MKIPALMILFLTGLNVAIAQPPPERPASPVQRYMQDLRAQDPVEFERLQNLRADDPGAFRAHMRGIMEDRVMKMLEQERPGIFQALSGLSSEDRAWLMKKLENRPHGPPGGWTAAPPERKTVNHGPVRMRTLVEAYREEDDPEKKEDIKNQIRDAVSREYDERIRMRAAQLQEMESRVEDLRKALRTGEEEKQRFLNKKMSQWLEEESVPAQE